MQLFQFILLMNIEINFEFALVFMVIRCKEYDSDRHYIHLYKHHGLDPVIFLVEFVDNNAAHNISNGGCNEANTHIETGDINHA